MTEIELPQEHTDDGQSKGSDLAGAVRPPLVASADPDDPFGGDFWAWVLKVVTWMARRLACGTNADDIAGIALLDAVRAHDAGRWAAEKEPIVFLNHLVRVARAQVLRSHNRRHRVVSLWTDVTARDGRASLDPVGQEPDVLERLQYREAVEALVDAVMQLEPIDREIIVLRDFEGLTFAECGAALGISGAAARLRHLRAIHRLRLVLGARVPELRNLG